MNPFIAIPCILALLYHAHSRSSLTQAGILTAALTAITHALHPWAIFFALLGVFFLSGTAVTKVKHEVKATLTTTTTSATAANHEVKVKAAKGAKAQPTPRTAAQVLCNSLPATVAILLHTLYLDYLNRGLNNRLNGQSLSHCLPLPSSTLDSNTTGSEKFIHGFGPLLPYAIIAHYASAAADTFSSELGILAKSNPILITSFISSPLSPKTVSKGTNGGVTAFGLLAGLAGAAIIGAVSLALLSFCSTWHLSQKLALLIGITLVGAMGSVLDSVLGAWFQATVVERESGKVVENEGGEKVVVRAGKNGGKEIVVTGSDLLSNNGVNLLMCSAMSVAGMSVAWVLSNLFT